MTITIEPLGGLGNQLFVYALGLHLSQKHNAPLEADLWRFRNYDWHRYELDSISTQISRTYSSPHRGRFTDTARRVYREITAARPKKMRANRRLAIERTYFFNEEFLAFSSNVRLSGYFQSWRYIESVSEQLRSEILSPINPSAWLDTTRRDLQHFQGWIGVHVRMGNYRHIAGMGIIMEDYYQRAIALLDNCYDSFRIVIFSDEPETVKSFRCFQGERFSFIDAPQATRPVESLIVMSDASALILGNSTFSWWAAYLQDSPNRIVIAPRPWLDRRDFNERDLFPTHWLTVGRAHVPH